MLVYGDCLNKLKELDDNSVDSLVTDPPAGIAFMGKEWDEDKGGSKQWIAWLSSVMKEALRVLKPGAHGFVWAIPRTSHWTATALEDAGFEIRDKIFHHFGSGFPKSFNINKALEKDGKICVCDGKENSKQSSDLRSMQSHIHSQNEDSYLEVENLQSKMSGYNENVGARASYSSEENIVKYEGSKRDSSIRTQQPLLEGRGNLQAQQGQLYRPEVCSMSQGVPTNGTQGRLHNGASLGDGSIPGSNSEPGRSRTSQGSQHEKQFVREPGTIFEQWSTQTCGSCGKTKVQSGLGTALKPSTEEWILVRKPCSERTVAANVLKHGTGGINIDASRIEGTPRTTHKDGNKITNSQGMFTMGESGYIPPTPSGRFPANLILSHNPDCVEVGVKKVKAIKGGNSTNVGNKVYGKYEAGLDSAPCGFGDADGTETVSAFECTPGCAVAGINIQAQQEVGRFFYCAKASKSERNEGCEGLPEKESGIKNNSGRGYSETDPYKQIVNKNHHPTVKPIRLMSYLITMITPPNGLVLDPFMGSGSTGVAALKAGFRFLGIEKELEYFKIAESRIINTLAILMDKEEEEKCSKKVS